MPSPSNFISSAFNGVRRGSKRSSSKTPRKDANESDSQVSGKAGTGDASRTGSPLANPSNVSTPKTADQPPTPSETTTTTSASDNTASGNGSHEVASPESAKGAADAGSAAPNSVPVILPDHRKILARINDSGLDLKGNGHQSPARSSVDVMSSRRSSMESGRTGASNELHVHPGEVMAISQLDKVPIGTEVEFRARIHTQRQLSKALDFLLLRDQTHSIQGVLARDDLEMIKWVHKLHPESLVQVRGILKEPPEPVRSASHPGIEVSVSSIHLVNAAQHAPWNNYKPPESLRNRMSARILDLRHPSNQVLFRVRSLVARKFRDTLEDKGFVEINSPKLQPAATETGAAVFKVNYFGRNAFLAQSPQLSKQMAVSADFRRVFEIGPVFRAENSNTHRHLTEYTGLDIEMAIEKDYHEVIYVIDDFLKAVFEAVYSLPEIELLQKRWPSGEFKWLDETLILDFREGIQMLRDDGRDVEEEDLSTPDEIRLGQLVREKFGTDYYVLDKFPTSARPFYTHRDTEDRTRTRSFDIFIRGQEICSGGQRIHDLEELRTNMLAYGMSDEGMEDYLMAFELGAPPHAGAGLGLERIVAWMLELGDVRYASLFHRDPKSLPEHKLGLPHPEADTTKTHPDDTMPPLEKLIANYGDASNTSWLDDRFELWRHPTGAAVGYVKQEKFVMVTGDPLCDKKQYREICKAFITFATTELHLTPIWMLVSYEVQLILGHDMQWRTLSCTEEQRVDTDKHRINGNGPKARRVEREGVKIHEIKPDADFKTRADHAIEEWKSARKGKQVHLTEVRPWVDPEHRRYFAAEKDNKVLSLVVLHKLSPRHGWQVKWALDFPHSVNGAIEVLVEYALSSVSGQVTFGVGVSEKLTPGEHMNGMRARFLASTYKSIVDSLGLRRKADFRSKFGVLGEEVYICYPKHGVGLRDLQQIIKFFQD
ncbi:aspartyl-tRNA synthetase [Geosmithia morbida]|uniref:Probable aspartate--tRNA ligase, cytoplasmic n=1 Tax=Geosmithia morbida TaxID=1094350 RepID=A0A9P5D3S3_9HYPO|nr:aspartyl-tRNA synthetase [Geosmithia morbida]KAF4125267.1 aspartyl-tRNA synthetase [Geosmithia morbida]